MRQRVYLVGLFPSIFSATARYPLLSMRDFISQLKEYPPELTSRMDFIRNFVKRLTAEGFDVKIVHSVSPLGVWLSMRYRLNSSFYCIVNGQRIRLVGDLDWLIREIKAAAHKERRKFFGGFRVVK
ncbi:MAG: hypothetical protein QW240_08315 [Candidatus Caldarchaeum sp.]